jgi:hypothetical protein
MKKLINAKLQEIWPVEWRFNKIKENYIFSEGPELKKKILIYLKLILKKLIHKIDVKKFDFIFSFLFMF